MLPEHPRRAGPIAQDMQEPGVFKIAVFAKTDIGMVRSGNEDNFLILNLSTADTWTPDTVSGDPDERLTTFTQSRVGSLLAVTDGMGGALAGEVASRLAVECVRDRMLELQSSPTYSKFPFHERLRLSIELANVHIFQMSMKRPECQGMGATFTALGLNGKTAYFGQVGDSRAYIIRAGQIQQVTRDQSLVGQLVQSGHITEEEAERHSYKNVILQALGAAPRVNVTVDKLPLRDLDIVVLCSDGLSNKVRAEEIKHIVDRAPSLKEACEDLIMLANQRGGEDNITALVTQFTGGGLPPPDAPYEDSISSAEGGTIPLSSERSLSMIAGSSLLARWGVETIPRDPTLPLEVNLDAMEEEETLRPTEARTQSIPTEKLESET
ncbi:MAG TPA: PP2C family serine/threonine-protein phosphatase [Blastocatellia bacterium]|nr:PP2C family serine/threonine-protein phosphatase [Blastocatellia bacterium]